MSNRSTFASLNRRRIMFYQFQKMIFLLLIVASTSMPSVLGFVTQISSPLKINPTRQISSLSTQTTTTQREMMMDNWQEFVFNAQALASSWATSSLDDTAAASSVISSTSSINWVSSCLVMYGAGILTSVSPCVWGLLPLTISYISTAAGEREDKDAALPTIAFATGLAVVFCTLGFLAATVGGAVYGNSSTTSIWLPIFSNVICFVMGLQLLEFIELPLLSFKPSSSSSMSSIFSSSGDGQAQQQQEELLFFDDSGSVVTLSSTKEYEERTMESSRSNEFQSLLKVFILGGTSALVASPCATPVLTSILAFVADSSANGTNPVVGVLLLFIYTIGYSTPLLLAGATGGQFLVKVRELGTSNDEGNSSNASIYAQIAPWISPITAGILLWYGTTGLLTAIIGDPSIAGLRPIL